MLVLKNVSLNNPTIKNINIEIKDNLIIAGPSGSGKTTLLRIIAGLENYTGNIELDNINIDKKIGKKRGFSLAWQDNRLLPNLNVKENISLGGNLEHLEYFSKILKVNNLLDKFPNELSGGEAQRINILRALCTDAKVILLDEPMQGIDSLLVRKSLRLILKKLNELNKLVILVTHELYQVYGLIDNILIMKNGIVNTYGNFKEIYENPPNAWIANFFGSYTILDSNDLKQFEQHSGKKACMIRPEWFKIKIYPFKRELEFNATVIGVKWNGSSNRISLVLDNTNKPFTAEVYADIPIQKGNRVYVNFKKYSEPSWIINS